MRFFICTTAGGDTKAEPFVLNATEWVESHLISRSQAKDMGVLDGAKVIMHISWGELGVEGRMLKGFEGRTLADEDEGEESSGQTRKAPKKEKKSRAEKRERNFKNGGGRR